MKHYVASFESAGRTEPGRFSDRYHLSIGLAFVILSTAALCLPLLNLVSWLGDEGIVLRGAAELVHGHRMYADFFTFDPPAGDLIVAGWLKLFGPSFLGVRLLATLLIVGITSFSYLACLEASRRTVLAAFLAVAWLATSPSAWVVVISHRWLADVFSMAACWLTLRAVTREHDATMLATLAGLCAGTAAMAVSSSGLYTILASLGAMFRLRGEHKPLIACAAGSLVAPVLSLAYIVLNGAFIPAYQDIVQFTLNDYAAVQKVPFGYGEHWYYPQLYLFPLAFGLVLLAWFRETDRRASFRLVLTVLLFALAGLGSAYPGPERLHIAVAGPFALPALAYGVTRLTATWRPSAQRTMLALAAAWSLASAMSFVNQALIAMRAPLVATAVGSVRMTTNGSQNQNSEIFSFLASRPVDETFFFYPYMPLMPYLAAREQTSRYDIFIPNYFTAAQYFETCEVVTESAQWLILDRAHMTPAAWRAGFPAMKDPTPPETEAFQQTIEQNFPLQRIVGNFEIRHRTSATSSSGCDKILFH